MNLDYYRKAKGREPVVISLDSDDQPIQPFRSNTTVFVKAEHTDPMLVVVQQEEKNEKVAVKPAADSQTAEESIEMVAEYDESSNSY